MHYTTWMKKKGWQNRGRCVKKLEIISLATIFLMLQWGCTHTTGSFLSESIQRDIERIGVVVREGDEKSLEDSQTGFFSSMGKGAAHGSVLGGAGVFCMYGAIICIPVLAAAGAVGGSVYGVYQASSETLPTEVESLLTHAITDAGLSNLLVEDLVANAQASGYAMEAAKNPLLVTGKKQGGELPALWESFDTLLEKDK